MDSIRQAWTDARTLRWFVVLLVLAGAAAYGWLAPVRHLNAVVWLGGIAAAIGLLLLIQHPGLGLVVLVGLSFTLPLTIDTGGEVEITAPVLLIPVVTIAWLVDSMRRLELRVPSSRPLLPLLLFVLAGLLSLVAGNVYWDPLVPRPDNLLLVQLGQWSIFGLSAAAFFLGGVLGDRAGWLRVATWVFLGIGAVVVLEFYLPPLRRLLGWSNAEMAHRAMFWTWLGGLATGQLIFNRKLNQASRLGLFGLLLAATYVLWVRYNTWASGWLSFTLAVLATLWFWVWRRQRLAALILALIAVIVAVLLIPTLIEISGGERELDLSWGGRQLLYEAVFELVAEHPVLGLGPASYRHYGHSRWIWLGVGRSLYTNPNISSHNNYIDVYAQMGVVGLVLFVWFLIEIGLLGGRLKDRVPGGFQAGYVHGVLGALVGSLGAMMLADWFLPFVYNIGFPGFRTSALAWMFLGGLVALESQVARAAEGGRRAA